MSSVISTPLQMMHVFFQSPEKKEVFIVFDVYYIKYTVLDVVNQASEVCFIT